MMKKKTLTLCVFLFVFFGNQAWGLTGLGFGVRGGMIRDYKNDNLNLIPTQDQDWLKEMPVVGVHLKIGTLRVVHFEASVEYAWKETEIVLENLTRTEFSVNDLSLNATAKYVYSIPVLKPYLGAGAGIHRLVYGISNKDYDIFIPEDQNKMGFHVVGGILLSFPASPIELFAEARHTSIQTEGESTRYTTILGGLTFKLP
ncbi:MAG: outer membrane beta-barrel protein [Candidatus Zixiibacteriota bacterium]